MNNSLFLFTEGDHVYLQIETRLGWVTLIKDRLDGPISHVIHTSGIQTLTDNYIKTLTTNEED